MSQSDIHGVCPFCKYPILSVGDCFVCPGCKVPHHRECWQQNGGCTTFACKGKAVQYISNVYKDYSFEDLLEEYSSNKLVINIEDLFEDETIYKDDYDILLDGLPLEESDNNVSSSSWLGPLFWTIFLVGFLIWLYYVYN